MATPHEAQRTAMAAADSSDHDDDSERDAAQRDEAETDVSNSAHHESEPEEEGDPQAGMSSDDRARAAQELSFRKTERTRLAEELHVAARAGDQISVETLLVQDAALDFEDAGGKLAIHIATHHCHAKVVELLLEHGASIDTHDTAGRTQLLCEAESGNLEAVRFLLEHGASIDAADLERKTALFAAVGSGHLDVARVLVESGASVDATDQHSRTPLFAAAKQGHLETVQLLVERGASVDAKQKTGRTPLMFAASNGHLSVVKYLVERGRASVSEKDQKQWTALHVAAGNSRIDVADLLISAGAAVDVRGPGGATSLFLAAQRGNADMAALLIEKKADVNSKQDQGRTPLLAAAENGFVEIIKLLTDAGASVHETDDTGASALLVAVLKGNLDVAKLLVGFGASVNVKDGQGRTALMAAAKHGHTEIARFLVDKGANIHEQQSFGRTPLMLAISNRHREIVSLLLDRGASVETKDRAGWSPLHIAAGTKQPIILSTLIDKGARIDDRGPDDTTPLDIAVRKGFGDVISQLLEKGKKTAYEKPDYPVLLLRAGRYGRTSILLLLLNRDVSPHVRDDGDGETILLSTARWGYRGFFKFLVKRSTSSSAALPANAVSLLSGTLKTMHDLCAGAKESRTLYARVVERLAGVCTELQKRDSAERRKGELETFSEIVYRFCRQLLRYRSKHTVARFIGSNADSDNIRDLHEEIDTYMKSFFISGSKTAHENWRTQWAADREVQRAQLCDALGDERLPEAELADEEARVDAVTHLKFMLENFVKQSTSEEEVTRSVIRRLVGDNDSGWQVPTWFVSRYNIEIEDWKAVGESRFVEGKWLKSTVMVSRCNLELAQFEQIATTWKMLGHPNVLDLFGACHVSQPRFFVCDNSKNGTLRAYLRTHRDAVTKFTKLHEAAQGMLFLHKRKIVHGNLSTDKILVGDDGKTKIGGFELGIVSESSSWKPTTSSTRDVINWASPELQRGKPPTPASDIYSLGVCFLDLLTMDDPWRVRFGSSLRHYLLRSSSAPPPGIVDPSHWSLIKEMCAANPKHRVDMDYVVLNLDRLIENARLEQIGEAAEASALKRKAEHAVSGIVGGKGLELDLESWKVPDLSFRTFKTAFEELRGRCSKFPDSKDMAEHVQTRLQEVFKLILKKKKSPRDKAVNAFVETVQLFSEYLKTVLSQDSLARRVKSQRIVFAHHKFHTKIDKLLSMLSVPADDPHREWKPLHEQHIKALNDSIFLSVASGSKALDNRIVSLQQMSSVRRGNSSSPPVSFGMMKSGSAAQLWHIHLSEIESNESDFIAEGGFGRIYRGVWLGGTHIVVKFIDDDMVTKEWFLHEVKIWYILQHPHVVRLWGACNTGRRYFVCEYASNGTLSDYLKHKAEQPDPVKLRKLTWKLLHDAALGLQYVHEKSVIHNDLKCDNILVGDDGKAKLTDFGLSSMPKAGLIFRDVKRLGAVQWKAPEYLTSGEPTFESDIYSFAMCILEATTRDIPWGNTVPAVVTNKVKKGVIPMRPEGWEDDQWSLIELMTAKEPTQRVGVAFVVQRLQEIADEDNSSGTTEL